MLPSYSLIGDDERISVPLYPGVPTQIPVYGAAAAKATFGQYGDQHDIEYGAVAARAPSKKKKDGKQGKVSLCAVLATLLTLLTVVLALGCFLLTRSVSALWEWRRSAAAPRANTFDKSDMSLPAHESVPARTFDTIDSQYASPQRQYAPSPVPLSAPSSAGSASSCDSKTSTGSTKKHFILTQAGVIGEGSFGRTLRFAGMRAGCPRGTSNLAAVELTEEEEQKFGTGLELVVKMLPVGKHSPGSDMWNAAVRGLRQEANVYDIMNNEVANVPYYFGFEDWIAGEREEADMKLKMQLVPGSQPLRTVSTLPSGQHKLTWAHAALTPGSSSLSVRAVWRLAEQLLIAYKGLAAKNLVHRDFHHGNMLVHSFKNVQRGEFKAMAIDFGLTQKTGDALTYISAAMQMRAPEELKETCVDDLDKIIEAKKSEAYNFAGSLAKMKLGETVFNAMPTYARDFAVSRFASVVMEKLNEDFVAESNCDVAPLHAAGPVTGATPKSDVYSVGAILFDLLCRESESHVTKVPYPVLVRDGGRRAAYPAYFPQYSDNGESSTYVFDNLYDYSDTSHRRTQVRRCKALPGRTSDFVELIGDMLVANPAHRPSADLALRRLYTTGLVTHA